MLYPDQESNPSTHSPTEMTDEQLSLIIPTKQGPFVVAHRKIPRPGPGEVLVRLQATALNPFDARIHRDGTFVDSYPAVLGTDGAGIVEEVGEGVTRFDPGDRMYAISLLMAVL
jgi:NADPH:quinone reductase-like Zn-dependent oxidoreductase